MMLEVATENIWLKHGDLDAKNLAIIGQIMPVNHPQQAVTNDA